MERAGEWAAETVQALSRFVGPDWAFQGQLQALDGSSSPRELVTNIISLRKFLTQRGGTGLQVMLLEKNLPSEFSLRYLYVLTVNRAGDMFFSKN